VGITGHAENKFTRLGKEAGMDEIIAKPLYFKTLLEILRKNGLIS